MSARRILGLRRSPVAVTDPADSVVLMGAVLRCTLCESTWQATLGPFGDEIPPEEARCPRCTPEPPAAA